MIGFLAALLLSFAALGQPVLADVVASAEECCLSAPNTASGIRWLDDIRPDRLQHIEDRHLRGGALWDESTSYFNNADELNALVSDAADWTPIVQASGNLATIVDAGRPVGWDAATGAQTSLYIVIIKPGDGVWTAHPGLPRVGG